MYFQQDTTTIVFIYIKANKINKTRKKHLLRTRTYLLAKSHLITKITKKDNVMENATPYNPSHGINTIKEQTEAKPPPKLAYKKYLLSFTAAKIPPKLLDRHEKHNPKAKKGI